MFRQAIIYLLIFSTLSVNFSRYFVYAGFELNRNYIASTLCENRDKPWLHCNGKCYFIKKIKQAQENERREAAKDGLSRLEVSFFQEPFKLRFIEPVTLPDAKNPFPNYSYYYTSHYIEAVFRPPRSLA
ncbi:hypothetical protein KXD93_15025 [Mucilaginibacter sp. BJC16-A38]|uniref:hypothetical protein n=1 Tax=Mucilaginibacter phenanthrenivorans TaxID=1234842 RepID=UPI002158908E|nr:hypothetical protein [Mucilaginibacter phenanthrenivorans]MCR8558968.1 hypothetical protein [Mucilaginibacter phenanthrenivorans]